MVEGKLILIKLRHEEDIKNWENIEWFWVVSDEIATHDRVYISSLFNETVDEFDTSVPE